MTKLYFRSATNSTTGLPTTEQSALTILKNADAATVNRTLSTTKGTAQTSLVISTNAATSQQDCYFSRFVSSFLDMTSIGAQTWTYNFAAQESSTSANFPVSGTNQPVYINCYIWRPTTSTKIATILDGNSASVYDEMAIASFQLSAHGTFSGASVSFAQWDVLVFEVWFRVTQANATARTIIWYYDGLTENTGENASVSNHASFLDSPATLTFGTPPAGGTVDCTVTGKAVAQKHIIHG